MQSWYSGDLRVLYIPHSELSYPPASKIQSPDPSRSSAMVPSARITQLWPKAITQQITNLTKIKNVPQNHKIQKACQLTENKSINVHLKRRAHSKLPMASKNSSERSAMASLLFRAESDALRTKVRTPGNCLIKLSARADTHVQGVENRNVQQAFLGRLRINFSVLRTRALWKIMTPHQ